MSPETIVVVLAVVVAGAVLVWLATRARTRVVVEASPAERAQRRLDEGEIVGDAVPIAARGDAEAVSAGPDRTARVAGPRRDGGAVETGVAERDGTEPAFAAAAREPASAQPGRKPAVGWARRFEAPGGALDDDARLGLIGDLGIVRAPWGLPLLAQAYEEEPLASHRRAALTALAAYRHPDTENVFSVALHSDDDDERAIAELALSALRIRGALRP